MVERELPVSPGSGKKLMVHSEGFFFFFNTVCNCQHSNSFPFTYSSAGIDILK